MIQRDWLAKWAVYSPDKVAIKDHDTRQVLTYGELNYLGEQLARRLLDLGLGFGDRIAVLAEFCPEYVVLFAAAQKTGFTLVPLNYRLTGPEIDYLIGDSTPALLITEEKFADTAALAPRAAHVPHRWSLDELRDFCDSAAISPPLGGRGAERLSIPGDHPIFILYTSGTTGFPKGALYTHDMLFWNSINTAMSLIVTAESRTICVMPPFHTGGWNVLLTPFLHHGAYTCLLKKFDAATVLQLLESERPTLFMGVPTMLKMMADLPQFDRTDLSSLLYIIVGGEAMPVPLIERYHERGVFIRQGYGMTEVGPNLTSLHQADAVRKRGSIGRPNFYVQTRLVDEAGRDVPANTPGELWLRGPMVTPGYWHNTDATAKAFSDGWFRTGDMMVRDEEGFFYVVDRIKNMFISGGENVYPAEVERVLLRHGTVAEACVIGVPDAKWGEVGHAFVAVRPGQTVTETELREHCLANLAKFKVPRHFELVDTLPKNDTGKINRRLLREGVRSEE